MTVFAKSKSNVCHLFPVICPVPEGSAIKPIDEVLCNKTYPFFKEPNEFDSKDEDPQLLSSAIKKNEIVVLTKVYNYVKDRAVYVELEMFHDEELHYFTLIKETKYSWDSKLLHEKKTLITSLFNKTFKLIKS